MTVVDMGDILQEGKGAGHKVAGAFAAILRGKVCRGSRRASRGYPPGWMFEKCQIGRRRALL